MAKDSHEKNDVLYKIFASKYAVYIVLIVGVLMLLFAFGDIDILNTQKTQPQQQHYAKYLETKMEEVLTKIEGVGTVKVMITTKDAVINDRRGVPVVMSEMNPEVDGVVVIAQGAGNDRVKQMIYDACLAALPVKPHRVQVFTLKKGE